MIFIKFLRRSRFTLKMPTKKKTTNQKKRKEQKKQNNENACIYQVVSVVGRTNKKKNKN